MQRSKTPFKATPGGVMTMVVSSTWARTHGQWTEVPSLNIGALGRGSVEYGVMTSGHSVIESGHTSPELHPILFTGAGPVVSGAAISPIQPSIVQRILFTGAGPVMASAVVSSIQEPVVLGTPAEVIEQQRAELQSLERRLARLEEYMPAPDEERGESDSKQDNSDDGGTPR